MLLKRYSGLSRRTCLILLTILLSTFWLQTASPASAHGKLDKTSPEAGSTVDEAPTQLELYLSESINLEFSYVKLLDRARQEQPVGALEHIGGDENAVTVRLGSQLAPGIYTVVWRVLSTVDGHLTTGSFAFRVRGAAGQGTPTAGGTEEPFEPFAPVEGSGGTPFEGSAADPDPIRWLTRAAMLAASILLLGGCVFSVLVVEPTITKSNRLWWPTIGKTFGRIGVVSAGVLLLALGLDMLFQIAAIRETDLLGALAGLDQIAPIVSTTRYGFSWALKAASGVVLLGIMLFALRRSSGSGIWEIGIAGSSMLLLAQSLGSHAAAVSGAGEIIGIPLPMLSDWLHLVTVSTWIGGIGYMAIGLFPALRSLGVSAEERRAFLADAIPRFSRLAVISVIVLALSGTYTVLVYTTDLGALLASQYGQVLAVKVGLYAVLVGLGAVNLRRLTPLLQEKLSPASSTQVEARGPRTESVPASRLKRNIRVEAVLGVLALIGAGGLTLLPPPSSASGLAGSNSNPGTATVVPVPPTIAVLAPTPIPTAPPASSVQDVAGYRFTLDVTPSFDGDIVKLDIEKIAEEATPLTDISKVLFKIIPQDIDAGSLSYEAGREGEAAPNKQTWQATETILTLDGGYLVNVIVQRTESDDVKAAFRLDLSVERGLAIIPAQVIDVRLSTNPSPPVNGKADITITLVDGARRPVADATVVVNPFMPAHAHVEPTSVAKPMPGSPGTYTSQVDFDMGGAWLFIFNIEREGQPMLKTDASLEVIGPTATPYVATRTPTTTRTTTPTSEPTLTTVPR